MKKLIVIGIVIILGLGIVLIYLNDQYSKTAETMPSVSAGASLGGNTDKIKLISNGEKVDLKQYLVKDYVVVFDFYADWCGPCKVLGPKIEELVNKDSKLLLRKINIVNWSSDVSKQYLIQFVPNVRVYNTQGQLVGEPTPDYDAIVQYIGQAKK
ncbi:MAG: thioredoxin domain-containing protein [bacterium]|nr:thioredoxin domain-containing protein [bacterium]